METIPSLLAARVRAALAGIADVSPNVSSATDARFGDYQTNVAMALAKAEVAGYPLIGQGATRIGLRFVDRADLFSRAAALRGMVRDLCAGEDFLLFPEGTTTAGEDLAPLHEGGLRMAHRLGVKLLPLRLASLDPQYPWTGDASLVPHLNRVAHSRDTRVSVLPGPVLDPAQWRDEDQWVEAIRGHLGRPAA